MARRKPVPPPLEAHVLVLSRRRCALCYGLERDSSEKSGQICHIDQNSSNNSAENLIFLCLHHHDAYDSRTSQSKGFTETELKHYRRELFSHLGVAFPQTDLATIARQVPNQKVNQESLKFLWDDIRDLVFGGFVPSDEIAATVLDMYSEEYESDQIAPYVVAITERLMEEHSRQQNNWPTFTDCDRMDSAFAALELDGIICRQDFADCLSCGYAEIWAEIDKEEKKGRRIRGFTFFHQQDTDRAVRGGGISLGYGSIINDNIPSDLEVAAEVVATLRRHGLAVRMNWQRKRPDLSSAKLTD